MKQTENTPKRMSKWDFIYKTTLLELLKKGKINPANAPATAFFLSIFIYLFDMVYTPVKLLVLYGKHSFKRK